MILFILLALGGQLDFASDADALSSLQQRILIEHTYGNIDQVAFNDYGRLIIQSHDCVSLVNPLIPDANNRHILRSAITKTVPDSSSFPAKTWKRITGAASSTDAREMVITTCSGNPVVWDIEADRLTRELPLPTMTPEFIHSLRPAMSVNLIAAILSFRTLDPLQGMYGINLWDLRAPGGLFLSYTAVPKHIALTPEDDVTVSIALAGGVIQLWDLRKNITGEGITNECSYPDYEIKTQSFWSNELIIGTDRPLSTVQSYAPDTEKQELIGYHDENETIKAIHVTAEEVTSAGNKKIKIWDKKRGTLKTKAAIPEVATGIPPLSVAYDGNSIVATTNGLSDVFIFEWER